MTEPAGTEEPKNSTLSFKQLKQLIADTVEGAFSSREAAKIDDQAGQPARRQLRQHTDSKPARSVEDEVQAALDRLQKEKDARALEEARDGRIKALEDKTAEKPPVERRKVHRFMKWGEN